MVRIIRERFSSYFLLLTSALFPFLLFPLQRPARLDLMSNLISAEALHAMLGEPELRVIDTRFDLKDPAAGLEAYKRGHIPGALYLDLDLDLSSSPAEHGGRHPLPDMTEFSEKLGSLGVSNSSQIVVYDDHAGVFAGRLWWLLRYAGHGAVRVLDGGLSAWTDAGFDTTDVMPEYEAGVFTAELRPDMVVDAQHVARNLDNPNVLLLDARAQERYRGETEPMDPKAGHIPGAINLPYTENLAGKTFKSPEALKERFENLELSQAEEVVVYCGSGVSAAHDLIALEEAGVKNAKLYVGSWSDWSSYPDNPVATGDEA